MPGSIFVNWPAPTSMSSVPDSTSGSKSLGAPGHSSWPLIFVAAPRIGSGNPKRLSIAPASDASRLTSIFVCCVFPAARHQPSAWIWPASLASSIFSMRQSVACGRATTSKRPRSRPFDINASLFTSSSGHGFASFSPRAFAGSAPCHGVSSPPSGTDMRCSRATRRPFGSCGVAALQSAVPAISRVVICSFQSSLVERADTLTSLNLRPNA